MTQLYSVTTSKTEFREIGDAFVFHLFFEPFTNRLSTKKSLQLIVDIDSSKSIYVILVLKAEMNLNV